MLTYQFMCNDCADKKTDSDGWTDIDESVNGYSKATGNYLFYVRSRMADKPKRPKCPRCGGHNTTTSFEYSVECWVRGNGIVNDKAGARRDMNKYTLMTNDPYGHMRQSGEVDDMIQRCENAGKDMVKIREQRRKNKKGTSRITKFCRLPERQHKVLMKMGEYEFGCSYRDFDEFDDVNKILTDLIPEYVCKVGDDTFKLMAEGRSYIDKCQMEDIK